MKGDFYVAEYALEKAHNFAFDAEMKGPCNCEDFMYHMFEARKHLMAARAAMANWREKE